MIQNIWQILWLSGFSNSPGLAPFPGDLKWNPNVFPPKNCGQIECQSVPDAVHLAREEMSRKVMTAAHSCNAPKVNAL